MSQIIPPVVIDYTNHRGERSLRAINPTATPIFYGSTTWHTEEQWLLEAFDLEKGDLRTFAVKNIHAWKTPKEATIDVSIAKQLQRSMERNGRMVMRLRRLGNILSGTDGDVILRQASSLLQSILKDEEPTWPEA